mgnify:CR=1 FL=1|jgi:hypothetical protein
MNKVLLPLTLSTFIFIGCGASTAPQPTQKSPSYTVQHSNADAAFDELEESTPEPKKHQPKVKKQERKIVARPSIVKKETTAKRSIVSRNRNTKEQTIETKYGLDNGLPTWFFNPDMNNQFGGIGIAKEQKRGGMPAQKRVAISIAKADLAKRLKIAVDTSLKTEKRVKNNTFIAKLSSLSRQGAQAYLQNTVVEDMWMSPSGELYVWLIIKQN